MGVVVVRSEPHSLLPPLVKGRTVRGTVRCNPGAATINHGGPPKAVEGWLRCRERYRCDRRQDVLLLIRSDTPSLYVSTPQSRLRRASPPWQGGPRGLSNFATKCNLLPLLQEAAKEAVRYFNQQQLSPQNPVFINLTSMRRRLKEPAPQKNGCSAFRKQNI